MQFNSSFQYGVNSCEPNYQQNLPLPCNGYNPKVVGEGDVTSLVLPDGTIQCYFIPTSVPWPTNLYVPSYSSFNYPCWNTNTGAWFVRSISNPISPLTQHYQRQLGIPCLRSFSSVDCNIKPANSGFQLKFHNDCWTSTTDLHYFYPCLRRYDCLPKTGVAVQVESPMNYEFICNKPCNCVPNCCRKVESGSHNVCNEIAESKQDSCMYIVRDEKGHRCSKCEPRNKAKRKKSSIKVDKRLQGKNCKCECEVSKSDKLVSTYEDQATGCNDAKACKTQTVRGSTFPVVKHDVHRKDIRTEVWIPKSRVSKRVTDISPDRTTYESDSSTRSNKCCCSDTDGE